jgi:hypothetical protein
MHIELFTAFSWNKIFSCTCCEKDHLLLERNKGQMNLIETRQKELDRLATSTVMY